MASSSSTPIKDSVPKINNEVAVGEDLAFQRRWWHFERAVWIFFAVVVVLDVLGVFGRGWVSKAHVHSDDATMEISYERIERFSTPSILDVQFGPPAVHNGNIELWVSESIVKSLGAQRVVPQPASSVVGSGGILYTFPATNPPAFVQFALQPSSPGIFPLQLRVPGHQTLSLKIVVMP